VDALTIPGLVRRAAREHGDREAIVDGAVRMTFRELEDVMVASTRAAVAAGLEPGDRASIWAPNIHQWIAAAP
jgi:acyl-CoA synthetase (AMP-forming)/AMP-acid ligase II